MTGAAVALAVLAGLAGSVQVAMMGRFGARIGTVEALTFATAGLFGVDQIAISWPRAVGIGLLAVGAALSLVK